MKSFPPVAIICNYSLFNDRWCYQIFFGNKREKIPRNRVRWETKRSQERKGQQLYASYKSQSPTSFLSPLYFFFVSLLSTRFSCPFYRSSCIFGDLNNFAYRLDPCRRGLRQSLLTSSEFEQRPSSESERVEMKQNRAAVDVSCRHFPPISLASPPPSSCCNPLLLEMWRQKTPPKNFYLFWKKSFYLQTVNGLSSRSCENLLESVTKDPYVIHWLNRILKLTLKCNIRFSDVIISNDILCQIMLSARILSVRPAGCTRRGSSTCKEKHQLFSPH